MNETITITGNIATEPEHKHPEGGVSITTFRVASGQRRRMNSMAAVIASSGYPHHPKSTER